MYPEGNLTPYHKITNFVDNSLYNFDAQFIRNTNEVPSTYSNVCILGLGGIGSWVGMYISHIKEIKNVILFDNDRIELHNLNRTPFRYTDIGELKVDAVADLIYSNNRFVNVFPIPFLFSNNESITQISNELDKIIRIKSVFYNSITIIDCRDSYVCDYEYIKEFFANEMNYRNVEIIRAAYNGTSITIDFDPINNYVFGRNGYTTVPSHFLPASLAAWLAVYCTTYREIIANKFPDFNKSHYTFDLSNLFDFIYHGVKQNSHENKDTYKHVQRI